MTENLMPHRSHCAYVPRASVAILTFMLLSACAGTSERESAALGQARDVYATAAEQSDIFEYADSSMRQAERHLQKAEELLKQTGNQTAVDHHAFLARQHVAIAEARLRRGSAQQDIERLEERRQALMLAARQREATLAARRAEAVEGELADTRMQLRMAEQRAKALAERLLELGVTSSRQED